MGRSATVALRLLQGFFAAANLGLSAYVVNWYLAVTQSGSPAPLNFLVFASCFSMLSLLYLELAPGFWPRATPPHAALAVEAANALFYFAGFIAYAVLLSGLVMCRGHVCTAGRVDTVVAAAAFCAWIASAILTAKGLFTARPRQPAGKAMQMELA